MKEVELGGLEGGGSWPEDYVWNCHLEILRKSAGIVLKTLSKELMYMGYLS